MQSQFICHSGFLPIGSRGSFSARSWSPRPCRSIQRSCYAVMCFFEKAFFLRIQTAFGCGALALRLATDPRCWLRMLEEGAATTFEAWGKEEKKNCSLCHPWATAPIILFTGRQRIY